MFWRLTFREIDNILAGTASKFRREHNERAWAVWHTAYLTAYAPEKPKNFTKLKRLLHGEKIAKRPTSPDWRTELAAFSAWAASFKGKPS